MVMLSRWLRAPSSRAAPLSPSPQPHPLACHLTWTSPAIIAACSHTPVHALSTALGACPHCSALHACAARSPDHSPQCFAAQFQLPSKCAPGAAAPLHAQLQHAPPALLQSHTLTWAPVVQVPHAQARSCRADRCPPPCSQQECLVSCCTALGMPHPPICALAAT